MVYVLKRNKKKNKYKYFVNEINKNRFYNKNVLFIISQLFLSEKMETI